VLNGVLAAPLMATMLLIATNPGIMGRLVLPWTMQAVGWLAAAVMLAASVAFLGM
jgi:Mn2+/Fe2+ NRAMP family transporter